MLLGEEWLELDEVASTQAIAGELLKLGVPKVAVVYARNQRNGKGRFGRLWLSNRGDSLTFSLVLWDHAEHPKPWLLGMAIALAAAEVLGSNVRWPNDLVFGDRKVGGILTELLANKDGGRVPVVGIGINIKQTGFPPELPHATSLFLETNVLREPREVAQEIADHIRSLPTPSDFADLSKSWAKADITAGKHYSLPSGQRAEALKVQDDGSLLCRVDGSEKVLMAAEALFG